MVIKDVIKTLAKGVTRFYRQYKNIEKNEMDAQKLRDRVIIIQPVATDGAHGNGFARNLESSVNGISEEVGQLEKNAKGVTFVDYLRRFMLSDKNREDISDLNDRFGRLTGDTSAAAAVETSGAVQQMKTSVSYLDNGPVPPDRVL